MELEPYVDKLGEQLAVAASAGGEEALSLARRLTAPLESGLRLTLLDALSAAAAEITSELAPGSVELRLRGTEPEFVVTMPPAETAGRPIAGSRGVGHERRSGRGRRGRDRADQPAAAGPAQEPGRAKRRPRGFVDQRVARARGRGGRRSRSAGRSARAPDRPLGPALYRLGALSAAAAIEDLLTETNDSQDPRHVSLRRRARTGFGDITIRLEAQRSDELLSGGRDHEDGSDRRGPALPSRASTRIERPFEDGHG